MLFIEGQLVGDAKVGLDGIAHSIQAAIALGPDNSGLSALFDGHFRLDPLLLAEMTFGNAEHAPGGDIIFLKNSIDLRRMEFLVPSVRDALHQIAHLLFHGRRQSESKLLFQHKSHPALAGDAVNADHIGFIFPAHIRRIYGQIGYIPAVSALPFLQPDHALADGILVGAGKSGKHQISRIGHPLVDFHAGKLLIGLPDLHNMGEIQSAVHPVAHHIHSHSDQIHIARALPVSKQGSLHSVSPRQNAEFRVADAAAPVVVGVDA